MAGQGGFPDAEKALNRFAEAYWPPLYHFIRRDGYNHEDARDLTQGFFAHFLGKQLLRRVTEPSGKFRSFLITCLKHFLSDEREREQALKRGGGATIISLDAFEIEERDTFEPVDHLTPDQIYERRWAQLVVSRAEGRLKKEYATRGKEQLYEALQGGLTGDRIVLPYVEIGSRLNMTESAVKAAARQLRERFFRFIRFEVERTVDERVQTTHEELGHLVSALGNR